MKPQSAGTIQMKATKQYFPVVPFIMLCTAVETCDFVNEILMTIPFSKTALNNVQVKKS